MSYVDVVGYAFHELVVMFPFDIETNTLGFFIALLNISTSTQHYLVCEILITYPHLSASFLIHAAELGVVLPEFTEGLLYHYSITALSNSDSELFDGSIRLCQLLQPVHSTLLERFTIP